MAGLLNFGRQNNQAGAKDRRLISEASFVVLDSELTGLRSNRDSIVSLGAVRMAGGSILLGDPYYRLVKPRSALTRDSVLIHGLTPSDLAGEQGSATILDEFRRYCGSDIIVGHCLAIDMEFIAREMKQALLGKMENALVDTAELYAWLRKRGLLARCDGLPPQVPDLFQLAGCLGLPVVEAHNAAEDAFLTAQVFQRFLPLLHDAGITTVGELIRIGDPSGGGDYISSSSDLPHF